jgi:hypothetical protein
LGFARALRVLAAPNQLTVAAVSTITEPAEFSVREGLDGYFTKPVEMHVLMAFVRDSGLR